MSPGFTRSHIWELKSAMAKFSIFSTDLPALPHMSTLSDSQPAPYSDFSNMSPGVAMSKLKLRRDLLKIKGLVNGRGYIWINLLSYHSLYDFGGHCFSNTPDCYLSYWFIQQSFLMCCCVGIEFFPLCFFFFLYHHVLIPTLLSSSLKAGKLGSWGPYKIKDWLKETTNQLVIKPQPLNMCPSS